MAEKLIVSKPLLPDEISSCGEKFGEEGETGDPKVSLLRHLSGDPEKVNPKLSIKEQVRLISYNKQREISRSAFTIDQLIGSGNFGTVLRGTVTGLQGPNSQTPVAIKTLNEPDNKDDLHAFIAEIKILSNLRPHLNLVDMVGCCTTEYDNDNPNIWLLLEFCSRGNMKEFLIQNRLQFFSPQSNNKDQESGHHFDGHLLVGWCYDIAKGMAYLGEHKIMHGDLAARNVLIDDDTGNYGNLIAKVADFGLSKAFYHDIRYVKKQRVLVPWKWMAIEYLKDSFFTLTSDVWSFAVVVWEMFSIGQEPYAGKSFDDIIPILENGHYLKCPQEINKLRHAEDLFTLYDKISKMCFIQDPGQRATFTDVVTMLEGELTKDQISTYEAINKTYLENICLKNINNQT